mmetsp:Transcript_55575/g.110437  ORF Transcript_55575/g.110437 Transcript_55575/m.110437 type:complete len:286 (+) Transcript_55575:67-924(+)
MESGIVRRASKGPSPIQNHVIWRSTHSAAAGTVHSDIQSRPDLSGSSLENVVFKDVSTSVETLSGINSTSQEPDINPCAKAGDELPDACKKKATEQDFLLKHGMWSVGSQGHIEGLCKPCHYVHTPKGCTSGSDCTFCHLPHVACSSQTGNRPSKEKRKACKGLLNSLQIMQGGHLDEASDLLKQVASQSLYMQRIIADKIQPEQDQGSAVNETQSEVVAVNARRAKIAQSLVKGFHTQTAQLATAAPAAAAASSASPSSTASTKDGAARPGDARKRCQSNLVSL